MAKKPSAAELKKEGEELAKQFAAMRKTPHNFAMQIGKVGIVFMADRKKPADALWRIAKKDGGSSKGAKGTATMKGKVMELDCDDPSAVPSGLARKAKVYFAERGQPAKVVIKGAEEEGEEGAEAEAEGQEAEAAAAPEAAPAEAGGGAGGAGGGEAPGDQAETAAKFDGVDGESTDAAANEDPVEVMRREFEEMQPDLDAAAASTNPGIVRKVAGLQSMFESQLEGNPKKARAIIGLIQTTIQTARDAGDVAEVPAGGVDPAAQAQRRSQIEELERGVDALLAEFA